MKRISTRIIAFFGILVFFICSGLGLAAYITSYDSVMDVLRETMPKAADEASATIEFAIQNQLNSLNIISSLDFMKILKDNNADDSALESFMSDEIRRTGHKQMILADRNGKVLYSNSAVTGIKDDPFFMSALSGVETVSEPMLDEDGSGIIMVYAVPVKIDGEIAGVLMAYRDGLELSEFAGRVRYGESGQAYLINRQGRTIAHANKDIILQILETATSDATSSATSAADTSDAVSSATSDPQAADAVSSATAGAGGEISDAQLRARERTSSQVGLTGFFEVQKLMMEGKKVMGNSITMVSRK